MGKTIVLGLWDSKVCSACALERYAWENYHFGDCGIPTIPKTIVFFPCIPLKSTYIAHIVHSYYLHSYTFDKSNVSVAIQLPSLMKIQ